MTVVVVVVIHDHNHDHGTSTTVFNSGSTTLSFCYLPLWYAHIFLYIYPISDLLQDLVARTSFI